MRRISRGALANNKTGFIIRSSRAGRTSIIEYAKHIRARELRAVQKRRYQSYNRAAKYAFY